MTRPLRSYPPIPAKQIPPGRILYLGRNIFVINNLSAAASVSVRSNTIVAIAKGKVVSYLLTARPKDQVELTLDPKEDAFAVHPHTSSAQFSHRNHYYQIPIAPNMVVQNNLEYDGILVEVVSEKLTITSVGGDYEGQEASISIAPFIGKPQKQVFTVALNKKGRIGIRAPSPSGIIPQLFNLFHRSV